MSQFSESVVEQAALARLIRALPAEALDVAFRRLTRPEGADLVARSRALNRLLVDGVTMENRWIDREIRDARSRMIDFNQFSANDGLSVNPFSMTEGKHMRRRQFVFPFLRMPEGQGAGK